MQEVVKFLSENPVQFLQPLSATARRNVTHLCFVLKKKESCGLGQIIKKKSMQKCNIILMLRSIF
ncbi:hypothetical protein CLNEO_24140 [Anaerotignum neopropionicum]|uniref:Orange domain-containing protein n=1 Tax=Anaerotignum neopropionicum TaxID=36847 RepID=A0A136WD38_9FIRM|nr:hypothetical protein CLNEO_24140 [Anaerotignum neopropionicum]